MKNPVKRVAAIHDLSGFGRASLTVVMPILSTMGIQVCPLPTAVLSTHSKFTEYHFVDLTEHMPEIIRHWKDLGLEFDAIYSGFLGSHRQIAIVIEFIEHFRRDRQLVVVDPVLGDDGVLYGPLSVDMIDEMRSLIAFADVITPNLTEAALLLDRPYNPKVTVNEVKDWIVSLAGKGPQIVIVTSVPEIEQGKKTSVIAYNNKDRRFWKVMCEYLPANYPGTGDAFASVVVGSLLQGDSLPIALDRAVQFISLGVRATFGYSYDTKEGILLERVLDNLRSSVQICSYEILD
ncbi:MAG: pyridoxamine kinase [Deltaproteobacteria bacterium]|nr:pyridoxamine kinase [Deltaproteobacteria bacterium]